MAGGGLVTALFTTIAAHAGGRVAGDSMAGVEALTPVGYGAAMLLGAAVHLMTAVAGAALLPSRPPG
jgi:hypothetical protein